MQLCIFNPEHDLCLAKGRANYVPPRSATEFARREAALMKVLYPDAVCISAYEAPPRSDIEEVVAWGWNPTVKWRLTRLGVDAALMPSDSAIAQWRELQHRSTLLPLQPDCRAVDTEAQLRSFCAAHEHVVMKAPWSGAGRGLRWIHRGALSAIDLAWFTKTVLAQRCVAVEPRRDVVADFALEYRSARSGLQFIGYSMFSTASGVYRSNLMLSDKQIACQIAALTSDRALKEIKSRVEEWLMQTIVPLYSGPLGIDMMADNKGNIYVAEMNLRHTMGMVAHEKIRKSTCRS